MKRLIKVITTSTLGLLFSTLGIIGHASAMPVGMHGMEHKAVSSANCATVCLSAPSDNKRDILIHTEEDDDKPAPLMGVPYESALDPFAEPDKRPRTSTHDEMVLRPPDLVVLFANFRF